MASQTASDPSGVEDRIVPRKRVVIPSHAQSYTEDLLLNIPVAYSLSKGALPFNTDANEYTHEFSVSLRAPEDERASLVNDEREALISCADSPTLPRVVSLLFWISLIQVFRHDEVDELPPYRKELALAVDKFSAFARETSTEHHIIPAILFLLGQIIFRMMYDLFPQSNSQLRPTCVKVAEHLSIHVHYELCGFYVQKETVRSFRKRYFMPAVVRHPYVKQSMAVPRPKRLGHHVVEDYSIPELAFGNVQGDALQERELQAVQENNRISQRMQGYIDIISNGKACYQSATKKDFERNFKRYQKVKNIIRFDTSLRSDLESTHHQVAMSEIIAAFAVPPSSSLCTTWLSPSTNLLFGQKGRSIPGKPTNDTFHVSMRARPVRSPRPASAPVHSRRRPLKKANGRCANRQEAAVANDSTPSSRPASSLSNTKSGRPTPPRLRPATAGTGMRTRDGVKSMTHISWAEQMKGYDVLTGLKKQHVDSEKLHKEERAYVKSLGELVSVKFMRLNVRADR